MFWQYNLSFQIVPTVWALAWLFRLSLDCTCYSPHCGLVCDCHWGQGSFRSHHLLPAGPCQSLCQLPGSCGVTANVRWYVGKCHIPLTQFLLYVVCVIEAAVAAAVRHADSAYMQGSLGTSACGISVNLSHVRKRNYSWLLCWVKPCAARTFERRPCQIGRFVTDIKGDIFLLRVLEVNDGL